eukprot:SAG31_NODE_28052_length_416_cov_0.804416_1_plen_30_part_01
MLTIAFGAMWLKGSVRVRTEAINNIRNKPL